MSPMRWVSRVVSEEELHHTLIRAQVAAALGSSSEASKVKIPVRNPRPLCNRVNLQFDFTKTASKISS